MGFFFEKNYYPFLLLQNTIKMRPPARIAPKKKKKKKKSPIQIKNIHPILISPFSRQPTGI